ncbi:hypothetical protein [Enterococcus casseliflavus]|uniref:hypothetical protein n=1 Tax=Enterococcus casseliflavus TaxID=37734 RepID=UPI0018832831|nr:hypothetical protein [Enterococcus casseliflavus]MBE9909365.1 hypothetical protein [Enterococcus casseliflavus]
MNNFWEILFIVAVIGFQSFAGYLGNKYLGAILPIVFSLIVIYLFLTGNLTFSFKDILMPFVGLFVLIGMYESADQSKKAKIKKEMEKMKAKDHINQ